MSQSYVPAALSRLVAERARGQCEYCRCLSGYHSDSFAVEHIVPEVKGGQTNESNLALSCLGCNACKGSFQAGVDPVTEKEAQLFHPRQQIWTEHFAWNAETTHIIGLTATGRATVVRLRLNRLPLVNLRKVLHHYGVHPPI